MPRSMKRIMLAIVCVCVCVAIYAQQEEVKMVSPLDVPLYLSANFGELRSNHFHSGVDFKTQGRTGLKVYAAEEGYVSRVAVSPWGYGKALYITHPTGYTTVYAHLQSFASFIADTVQAIQYEKESYAIDVTFAAGELPVSRGMMIARSGNSGSSGGPHLHFEIRHTESESPLNPLPLYRGLVKDNRPPEPQLVALYAHDGIGDGNHYARKKYQLQKVGNEYRPTTEMTGWGRVSLGIKVYDRMNETSNIYGVRHVRCEVDDEVLYDAVMDSITFHESRYINSLVDYKELRSNKGSAIMRTYIQPGSNLSMINGAMEGDGTFVIDEERVYHCRYELTDLHGNVSIVSMDIEGRRNDTPPLTPEGVKMEYKHDNEYATEEMNIQLPQGALYDDYYFTHSQYEDERYYSSVHEVGSRNVPLHKWCKLSLKLTCDTLPDEKYYMVSIYNEKKSVIIGEYDAGWYVADVREGGHYAIAADVTAPTIVAVKQQQWAKNGVVKLTIKDSGSGIMQYRGEIDGKYVLMEYDAKRHELSCKLKGLPYTLRGAKRLTVVVTDHCGNSKTAQYNITI